MIIWLEDRIRTVSAARIYFEREGLKFEILPSPSAVMELINQDGLKPTVFLIDIMLHGVRDLSELGVKNASTLSGTHAGYVFADRVLRAPGSNFADIPICFLTERTFEESLLLDVDALKKRGPAEVKIFQKYHQGDLEKLVRFLRELERSDE
jgi:CheY-like chemotaxis protein